MDAEKRFKTPTVGGCKSLESAAYIGFANSIEDELMPRLEAEALFDALQIGETLIDEDGDTWERIA